MKQKKLTKKEIKELQDQFPVSKKELERLKQIKREKLKNKMATIVIVFWLAMLIMVLYLFYLVWNYRFIGVW